MKYLPPSSPSTKYTLKNKVIIALLVLGSVFVFGVVVGRVTKGSDERSSLSAFTADRDSCIISNGMVTCIQGK
jgi:hypothetical protein